MNRVLKVVLLQAFFMLILSFNAFSSAASEEELIAYIEKPFNIAGQTVYIPSEYVKEAKRYLATNDISANEADKIIAKIDEGVTILNKSGVTDPKKLSYEQKKQLLALGQEAANYAGATLTYAKGYITITTEDGTKFGTYPVYTEKRGTFVQTGIDNTIFIILGIAFVIVIYGLIMYRRRAVNA